MRECVCEREREKEEEGERMEKEAQRDCSPSDLIIPFPNPGTRAGRIQSQGSEGQNEI